MGCCEELLVRNFPLFCKKLVPPPNPHSHRYIHGAVQWAHSDQHRHALACLSPEYMNDIPATLHVVRARSVCPRTCDPLARYRLVSYVDK
eukprot:911195-Prymnesium_polylepis.1